jgi:hypothetical protein
MERKYNTYVDGQKDRQKEKEEKQSDLFCNNLSPGKHFIYTNTLIQKSAMIVTHWSFKF